MSSESKSSLSDSEISKHPKYRYYSSEIHDALQFFDKAKEWADLAKCIQRIQKVLTKYNLPIVPHKLTLCKRIAQCLNPALPSGLHVKTLTVLATILERLGTERLAKDLYLYSMGLFPLFQYAAYGVKPAILDIFEKYYLPLNQHLVPCLSGFIMAILPGLEEESSVHYEKCISLLDKSMKNAGTDHFYRALWKSVIIGTSIRCPAINYLNSRLPKDITSESFPIYFPDNNTLVKNALIAGLSDKEVLTQRASMELCLNHFPLSSGIFDDWVPVSVAALQLITRKEVSLNRRLYTWYLGKDQSYFEKYGKSNCIAGIQGLLEQAPVSNALASRPFKIIMALFDKPEIGENIIDSLLVFVFYALQEFKEGYEFSREYINAANTLVDMIQPETIWTAAANVFTQRLFDDATIDPIIVIDTLVDLLKRDEETTTKHLPNLLCTIISGLVKVAERKDLSRVQSILRLARKVFGKFSSSAHLKEDSKQQSANLDGMYNAISLYQDTYAELVPKMFELMADDHSSNPSKHKHAVDIVVDSILLLGSLLVHLPTRFSTPPSQTNLPPYLQILQECCRLPQCDIRTTGVKVIVDMITLPNSGLSPEAQQFIIDKTKVCEEVAETLWELLHHSTSSFHYDVAQAYLSLSRVAFNQASDTVSSKLLEADPVAKVEHIRRFGILWKLLTDMTPRNLLSKNLFLVLDTLTDDLPMTRLAGRSWLGESVHKVHRILDPLLEIILDPSIRRKGYAYTTSYDTRRVLYGFRLLRDVMECDFAQFILVAADKPVSKEIMRLHHEQECQIYLSETYTSVIEVKNYVDILALSSLRFLQSDAPKGAAEFNSSNKIVKSTCASYLRYLLSKFYAHQPTSDICLKFQNIVLQCLAHSVDISDYVLQVQLLRLLRTIVTLQGSETDWTEPSTPHVRVHASAKPAKLRANPNPTICESPFFLPTITMGLQQSASHNVRIYWLELISSTLPYFMKDLPNIIQTIVNCLAEILACAQNPHDTQTSKDVLNVLDAFNSLSSLVIVREESELEPPKQKESGVIEMPVSLITGFVRAFVPEEETPPITSPLIEARNNVFKSFAFVLRSFANVWGGSDGSNINEDELVNKYAVQDRICKILEDIIRQFPNEYLYAGCLLWEKYRHVAEGGPNVPHIILEIINGLESATPKVVIRSIAFIISTVLKSKSRSSKDDFVSMHETTVLDFTNRFVSNTTKPLVKAWPDLVCVFDETMHSRSPTAYLLLLRIFNNFVMRAGPIEDKRLVRDMQIQAQKLVDHCCRIASDHSARLAGDLKADSKDGTIDRMKHLSLKALNMLSNIIPELYKTIFEDKDRAALTMMPIITNYLKDWTEANLPWSFSSIKFLSNLIDHGYSMKVWKKEVMEMFYDNHFFLMDFNAIGEWKRIINYIMSHDKTGFPALLTVTDKSLRSTLRAVGSMFSNGEQENALRARNIKRISFSLLAGEMDQWNPYLPQIQERLVEALKLTSAPVVHEQVLLCMRVLLVRMSGKRLTSFWPTILTELIRVLSNSKSDPNLLLAACKLVDQALITPSEMFNIYQWMFLYDTLKLQVDLSLSSAGKEFRKPPFTAFVDSLAHNASTESPIKLNGPTRTYRQPLILIRRVESLEQLYSYLRHFSEVAFENDISNSSPDYSVVERVIDADLIEYPNIANFDGTPEKLIQKHIQEEKKHVVSMISVSRPSLSMNSTADMEDISVDDDIEMNEEEFSQPLSTSKSFTDDDHHHSQNSDLGALDDSPLEEVNEEVLEEPLDDNELDDLDKEILSIKAGLQSAPDLS